MNLKWLIPGIIILIIFIIYYAFNSGRDTPDNYITEIEKQRKEKDDFMRKDPDSPFINHGRNEFKGLKYYPVDPAFRVEAEIIRFPSPELLTITLSDGSTEEYYRYAQARFTLEGMPQEVSLLKSKDYWNEDWLFLPFFDETSAEETYGGGRYLEIDYSGGIKAVIDFNLAYNPYCAYTDTYRCPLPPEENHLTVKVTAGEKNYTSHH